MNVIFIKGTIEIAEVVTNYYGGSFTCDILDPSTSLYIQQNIAMNELVEPITAFSTTIVNNQFQGDLNIELTNTLGVVSGDRLKIGNYIYVVSSVLNGIVTLKKGLYEALTAGALVDRVGNLGIYKADIVINTLGSFTLIATDTIFGLKTTSMITVKEKSIETMVNDIKNLEYAILGGQ